MAVKYSLVVDFEILKKEYQIMRSFRLIIPAASCLASILFLAMTTRLVGFSATAVGKPSSVEDRFSEIVDGHGLSDAEYVARLEGLLGDECSTATRSLILREIAQRCFNASNRSLEIDLKSQHCFLKALKYPWPIDQELKIYSQLGESMQRTADRNALDWPARRREIGEVLISGLDRAQASAVPEREARIIGELEAQFLGKAVNSNPNEADVLMLPSELAAFHNTSPGGDSLEEKAEQRAILQRRDSKLEKMRQEFEAESARRVAAPYHKRMLERQLAALYGADKDSLYELREISARIGDRDFAKELIDRIEEFSKDPSKLREFLEISKEYPGEAKTADQ